MKCFTIEQVTVYALTGHLGCNIPPKDQIVYQVKRLHQILTVYLSVLLSIQHPYI